MTNSSSRGEITFFQSDLRIQVHHQDLTMHALPQELACCCYADQSDHEDTQREMPEYSTVLITYEVSLLIPVCFSSHTDIFMINLNHIPCSLCIIQEEAFEITETLCLSTPKCSYILANSHWQGQERGRPSTALLTSCQGSILSSRNFLF